MAFDRHSVEADLAHLGCDRVSAFSLSAAIAEIVLNAVERKQGYVISYEADDHWILVDVLHYNAKAPRRQQTSKTAKITEERGRGYSMARSLVRDLKVIANRPRKGFTVRMVDEKRRPRNGEIV
jgi:anti-sigma regulatory factor (Ser/Thr protein kinase)